MPNKTSNYGLTKPLGSEYYDVGVQNGNMDVIDTELNNQEKRISALEQAGGGTASGNQNQLVGKKVLILGDSVGAGNGWEGGFANLINEDFPGVIISNLSVTGSKLSEKQLYWRLVNAYENSFIADYIIFDGGGNDLLTGVSNGTLDPDVYSAGGQGNEFDTNTVIGAFEHLITNIQKFFPHAKIIFYNLYKLHPDAANVPYATQRQAWQLLREAAKKYSIRYVDLYNEGNFTPASEEQWDAFMFDWVHINEAGYRRFWPLIKDALITV